MLVRSELPFTPDLLDTLRKHQLWQFRLWTVLATVRGWVASVGGRPERVLERIRTVRESPNPHGLCFGLALNRRFFSCLILAHAVVPYRTEGLDCTFTILLSAGPGEVCGSPR
jgi:hypothetical protein